MAVWRPGVSVRRGRAGRAVEPDGPGAGCRATGGVLRCGGEQCPPIRVDIPAMYAASENTMPVKVYVSEVLYPDDTSKPAEQGEVSAMLVTATEELSYKADYVEPGVFEVVIPVENLEPGSYTILLNAELEGAVPAATSGSTIIY